jgi:hypothetical protein
MLDYSPWLRRFARSPTHPVLLIFPKDVFSLATQENINPALIQIKFVILNTCAELDSFAH